MKFNFHLTSHELQSCDFPLYLQCQTDLFILITVITHTHICTISTSANTSRKQSVSVLWLVDHVTETVPLDVSFTLLPSRTRFCFILCVSAPLGFPLITPAPSSLHYGIDPPLKLSAAADLLVVRARSSCSTCCKLRVSYLSRELTLFRRNNTWAPSDLKDLKCPCLSRKLFWSQRETVPGNESVQTAFFFYVSIW